MFFFLPNELNNAGLAGDMYDDERPHDEYNSEGKAQHQQVDAGDPENSDGQEDYHEDDDDYNDNGMMHICDM